MERLTGHHKVEPSPNRTLVAEKVDTTFASLLRLPFLDFRRLKFRAPSDTSTEDNVGVVNEIVRVNFLTFIALLDIEVCSGTHLADVRSEGTFRVLHVRVFRREVEIVFQGMLRLITIRVELNGGSCR